MGGFTERSGLSDKRAVSVRRRPRSFDPAPRSTSARSHIGQPGSRRRSASPSWRERRANPTTGAASAWPAPNLRACALLWSLFVSRSFVTCLHLVDALQQFVHDLAIDRELLSGIEFIGVSHRSHKDRLQYIGHLRHA